MKMSVSCLSMSMNFIAISPFSTWSLRKWCLTHEGYNIIVHSIISHSLHYPKYLRTAASSSYILSPCGGLCNRRLLTS
jgi:hypothetical protein